MLNMHQMNVTLYKEFTYTWCVAVTNLYYELLASSIQLEDSNVKFNYARQFIFSHLAKKYCMLLQVIFKHLF